ncbi:MAG: NAD(P)/FAD-dependent oxidoreductase [Anaerolineae bacterium]
MTHYKFLVVGTGMIGSAAMRHLSLLSDSVCGIGADEPTDPENHNGVFASHYDQGRLARKFGKNLVWVPLAVHSIDRYPEIEQQSGITFHGQVGAFMALKAKGGSRYVLDDLKEAMVEHDVSADVYESGDLRWKEQFPFLNFPDGYRVVFEHKPAGYVNPRQLRKAQLACAIDNGATSLGEEVATIKPSADFVEVILDDGRRFTADKVLVAAGAFVNKPGILPTHIPIKAQTEVIVLGEVSAAEVERLKEMPTVIYQIDDSEISDLYMAPPLLYPDGKWKIKMGANTVSDEYPADTAAIGEWFRTGDSDQHKEALMRALTSQLPDVVFNSFETKKCVLTITPSGNPIIDQADESGRLFVATGGNGAAAKSSDEIGRLAAEFVFDGRWESELERSGFQLNANQD